MVSANLTLVFVNDSIKHAMSNMCKINFSNIIIAGKSPFLKNGMLDLAAIDKVDYIGYPKQAGLRFFLCIHIKTKESPNFNLALLLPECDIDSCEKLYDVLTSPDSINKTNEILNFNYSEGDYKLLQKLVKRAKDKNHEMGSCPDTILNLIRTHRALPKFHEFFPTKLNGGKKSIHICKGMISFELS